MLDGTDAITERIADSVLLLVAAMRLHSPSVSLLMIGRIDIKVTQNTLLKFIFELTSASFAVAVVFLLVFFVSESTFFAQKNRLSRGIA